MKTLTILFALVLTAVTLVSQEKKSAKELTGLNIGSMAPSFMAQTNSGDSFNLKDALQNGPVVIIFYRGFWCPVCNKHLKSIQDSLQQISKMGAQVIGVSPEKPTYLNMMAKETGAEFKLLYDEDYKISDAFDVTFTPSKTTRTIYNVALGAKLKETHSDDSERLPIPATFIIGQNGKILWRHFDPDYKERASVKEILDHLPLKVDINPLY